MPTLADLISGLSLLSVVAILLFGKRLMRRVSKRTLRVVAFIGSIATGIAAAVLSFTLNEPAGYTICAVCALPALNQGYHLWRGN